MSETNRDLSGSAARHHEETGGNVPTGKTPVSLGGDAAKQAADYGDSTNEAHGIPAVPRGEFRATRQVKMSSALGARLVEPEAAKPDLSKRTAADYLPPHLKAQLIAEGKLPAEPGMTPAPAAVIPEAKSATEAVPQPAEESQVQPKGVLGSLARMFRKLF